MAGTLKRWDGTQFKTGGTLKRWDGTQFKAGGTMRRWNGVHFVPDPARGTAINSNTAEGGTDGTAITLVNQTGGASGTQFSQINGGAIAFSSTSVAQGAMAYRLTQAAGSVCSFTWGTATPTEIFLRGYYYFTGYGTASHGIMDSYNGSSTIFRLSMTGTATTAGQLRLVYTSTTTLAQSTGALALNTWYRIELRAKVGTTDGAMEARAYIGSTYTVAASVSATNVNTGALALNNVKFGSNTGATTPTIPVVYMDNIAYGTTGWIGA
jgi:hypothetical protein